MKRFMVAEEVFIIVRELSVDGKFRWKDYLNAYDAVYGPAHWPWQKKDRKYLHMTLGSMLKAQVKGGTIVRTWGISGRGGYSFVRKSWVGTTVNHRDIQPAHPLYSGPRDPRRMPMPRFIEYTDPRVK
jgi:hypothetical protein